MSTKSFRLVAVSLGLALALPSWIAAQGTRPPMAASAAAQMGRAPTESDIYCAGFFAPRSLEADMTVLGSEDGGFKNEFADRDFVYLSKGKATAPGGQYMLVRPVKDINPKESFPGQRQFVQRLGTLYAEIARIQVRVVQEGSAAAEVMHACEPVVAGDLAIPLAARPAPPYHSPKVVERFAPSSGKSTGVVVLAKEFRQILGDGQIVYLNVGKKQGAEVGSYLRVFRSYLSMDRDVFQQMNREYLTEVMGQRLGRKLTRSERASLPRTVLGEVLLLSVGEDSSTGIITFSREEISPGDELELE